MHTCTPACILTCTDRPRDVDVAAHQMAIKMLHTPGQLYIRHLNGGGGKNEFTEGSLFYPDFYSCLCPSLFLQVSGVLDAPIGKVTICFMHMVGAAELKAWDAAEAAAALDIFSGIVEGEAVRCQGYLVNCRLRQSDLKVWACVAHFRQDRLTAFTWRVYWNRSKPAYLQGRHPVSLGFNSLWPA
jgi:hypothetical protein